MDGSLLEDGRELSRLDGLDDTRRLLRQRMNGFAGSDGEGTGLEGCRGRRNERGAFSKAGILTRQATPRGIPAKFISLLLKLKRLEQGIFSRFLPALPDPHCPLLGSFLSLEAIRAARTDEMKIS